MGSKTAELIAKIQTQCNTLLGVRCHKGVEVVFGSRGALCELSLREVYASPGSTHVRPGRSTQEILLAQ